ncbi:variable surface protein [Plasmodium gonderi]|uniref:Variable surface protein n=1 Tax=Plasmodium gonderi TaxID=77519 RepID=A0A1Y1JSU0_PLAGO|nr:variable surface protein [Plasmodium gonderi]GAW84498.1 variable surface protein [Plasmodium gonderi]
MHTMSIDYLDYNDYELYSGKIPNFPKESVSDKNIEEFFNSVNSIGTIKPIVSAYCWILKQYFDNINSIDLSDNNKICNYIKYWIKTEIEGKHKNDVHNIFNYLIKYVNNHNSVAKLKKCNFHTNILDDSKYEKIKKHYNVYNMYWFIINWIRNKHPGNALCDYIVLFIDNSNKFITTLNDAEDNDFLNKLYNIRCIFESNQSISSKKCRNEFNDNQTPRESGLMNCFTSHTDNQTYLEKDSVKIFARSNTNKYVIITAVLITIIIGTISLYFYKFNESWKKLRFSNQRKIRMTNYVNI